MHAVHLADAFTQRYQLTNHFTLSTSKCQSHCFWIAQKCIWFGCCLVWMLCVLCPGNSWWKMSRLLFNWWKAVQESPEVCKTRSTIGSWCESLRDCIHALLLMWKHACMDGWSNEDDVTKSVTEDLEIVVVLFTVKLLEVEDTRVRTTLRPLFFTPSFVTRRWEAQWLQKRRSYRPGGLLESVITTAVFSRLSCSLELSSGSVWSSVFFHTSLDPLVRVCKVFGQM